MNLDLNIAKIDENKRLVLGKVKSVKPGSGSAAENVVNVELEGSVWNSELEQEELKTLNIAFWNTDVVALADRVKAAKVREGSILMVEIYEKDDKCNGNRFWYKGHCQIPAKEGTKERNIFMGTVASIQTNVTANNNKYTRISMPVDVVRGGEPEWMSIAFWNNEKSNIADRAEKCLGVRNGKKAKAVVICGETKEYDGRPQYNGFDFKLIPNEPDETE